MSEKIKKSQKKDGLLLVQCPFREGRLAIDIGTGSRRTTFRIHASCILRSSLSNSLADTHKEKNKKEVIRKRKREWKEKARTHAGPECIKIRFSNANF